MKDLGQNSKDNEIKAPRHKTCSTCQNFLPLMDFHLKGTSPKGKICYQSSCKECSKKQRKSQNQRTLQADLPPQRSPKFQVAEVLIKNIDQKLTCNDMSAIFQTYIEAIFHAQTT